MQAEHIKVHTLPNLFSCKRKEAVFPARARVSDIIEQSLPTLRDIENVKVYITDQAGQLEPLIVEPSLWSSTLVKKDMIVTLRVCPTGGGDSKDVIRIVASIALIFVGAFYGAALGGFLLGADVAATTAFAVGAGLINLVGALAINALIPPPQPNFDRGNPGIKESPTLTLTGSSNQMNPYGVVPRAFGLYRVYPVMAAQPYTEISGNDQFLRLLFDFGYGELELSDLRIGEIAIANFDEVETEIKFGTPSDTPIELYSNIVSENSFSLEVTNAGGAEIITTENDSNEAIVDGAFQGLVSISDNGDYNNHSVQIKYEYSIADAGSWTVVSTETYTSNTTQVYYITKRIVLPTTDQYDIRITRITADFASNLVRDEFLITSLKSVELSPPVNVTGRCLVAMRIKATGQLNGVVDQFNALVQAKLPTWNGSAWTAAVATRNPAWAFAEVLRGAANGDPVADGLVDGDVLKDWADANDVLGQDGEPKWRFDGVIDYATTVFEACRDIAAVGRASFTVLDGKFAVVRDVEQTTPIQHFSPRNSWSFSASKIFIDPVHGIKCRYVNSDRDYQTDEVIAYDDGFDASNATSFQTIQYWGATTTNQAWREGRYALAVARLRPEIYSLTCDIENLICTRGDLVRVLHDVTSWGQKAARILTVTLNGSSEATNVTLDEIMTMEGGNTYNLRLRSNVGVTSVESIVLDVGSTNDLEFTTPIAAGSVPAVGDLVLFGQTDLESVELIVQRIDAGADLTAVLTLLDASPAIHTSDTGAIPAFDPKVTSIPKFLHSLPATPNILQIYSDELAIQYNADGTSTPQIIIDISPQDLGTTVPRTAVQVRHRLSGSNQKYTFFEVKADETRIIISPVDENKSYDFGVRALSFLGESSAWMSRFTYSVIGRNTPPATPSNFKINFVETSAYITWSPNTETDLSNYILKFSPLTSGATYLDAMVIDDELPKFSVSMVSPARTGTYFLKAVDTLGKSSLVAAEVTTIYDTFKDVNLIQTVTEDPSFAGVKTDVVLTDGVLILGNSTLWDSITGNIDDWLGLIDAGGGTGGTGDVIPLGTYDFATVVDLGSVYTSRVTATIQQTGIDYANSFDALQGNVDTWEGLWDDLTEDAAFDVNAKMQVAVTDDDPAGAPTWSAWIDFFVGDFKGRGLKFRCVMTSNNTMQTPSVSALSVQVDMPDRVDGDEDVSSGAAPKAIVYSPAFKTIKSIAITASDLLQGDFFDITSKSSTGFTITFKNSVGTTVDRTFDWTAQGWGHLVT